MVLKRSSHLRLYGSVWLKRVLFTLLGGILSFLIALFAFYPQSGVNSIRYSKVFYDKNRVLLGARISPDEKWRFQVELDRVSPSLIKALIEFEDKRFYNHFGVDPLSILRAFWDNITSRQISSGASTLTMQTARLIWKTHQNGRWVGKFYQIFRAIQLEIFYTKREILGLYFNLAPYGKNIEGVTAASWLYYGKPPSKLNWTEAVHMAIAPKSPNRFRLDRFPEKAQKLCEKVVQSLTEKAVLSNRELLFLNCASRHAKLRKLPNYAPHFVDRLYSDSGRDSSLIEQPAVMSDPDRNHIVTTLDLNRQIDIEAILQNYVEKLSRSIVYFGSVIVIDNETGGIVTYIGSPDFNKEQFGQVDGVRAIRSPGSTLKPFLYARALESGEYNPGSLLLNVPLSYRGFRPLNFNRKEFGITHFAEALQKSYNLPAIDLDIKLGRKKDLYSFLSDVDISTLTYSRNQYGHNIVLGGAEMRMDELAALYVMMARDGKSIPIQFLHEKNPDLSPRQMLTPESVFIVSEILRGTPVPQFKVSSDLFKNFPDIAWKTGTSSKRRDVWTFAYNKKFTVGVWFGDISGFQTEQFSGRKIAAPLVFRIFRYLNSEVKSIWPATPDNVVKHSVCVLSGNYPGRDCQGTVEVSHINNVTHKETCKLHRKIWIEKSSGERLSPKCIESMKIPESEYTEKSAVFWPAEIHTWLAKKRSAFALPPFKNGCVPTDVLRGKPPILQTPIDGETYAVLGSDYHDPSRVNFTRIVFEAAVDGEVNHLKWFLNKKPLTETAPGEMFVWLPTPGKHKLVVIDDFGRKSTANFTVKLR